MKKHFCSSERSLSKIYCAVRQCVCKSNALASTTYSSVNVFKRLFSHFTSCPLQELNLATIFSEISETGIRNKERFDNLQKNNRYTFHYSNKKDRSFVDKAGLLVEKIIYSNYGILKHLTLTLTDSNHTNKIANRL